MKHLIINLLVSSALSGAALAGSHDWSGFYAGGFIGYDTGTLSSFDEVGDPDGVLDTVGTAYGGFAGYNYQFGNLVFGAESSFAGNYIPFVGFVNGGIDNAIDLKLRAGRSMGQTLFYAVAGASFADNLSELGPASASGFNIGAGVERQIGENLFIGAEYLYRSLNGDYSEVLIGSDSTFTYRASTVQLRAGWRF